MTRERWRRAYSERPALFDDFARAEDPGGLLDRALLGPGLLSHGRVLEIGCGTGRLAERLSASTKRYLALDREAGMLELASRRLSPLPNARTIHADAGAIPLPGDSVDDLVAAWVVGHMPQAQRHRVLSEARRVSRPGARLFVLESADESEFQSLRDESGGRRDAGLVARLASEGFELLQCVETAIEFDSFEDALRVLGFLCGTESALRENPRRRFGHAVQLLSLAL